MKQKVVHCMVEEYDVYIGRGKGSIWGNPFTHKDGTAAKIKVASVEEAIERYREYVMSSPDLMSKLSQLKGKTLGCWCAPKGGLTTDDRPFKCHGQILLEIMEELDA